MPTVLNSICLMKNIEYIPDKIVTMQIQKIPKYNLNFFMTNTSQINKQIFKFGSAKKRRDRICVSKFVSFFCILLSNKFDDLLFNFALG